MKLSNLSALHQHYVKRVGLIFAGAFITMEIIAKLAGKLQLMDTKLINLYTLIALSMAVFSKEKTDDERSQLIRYFTMKKSFQFLILELVIIQVFELQFELILVAISALAFYLITFYITNYFNPDFLFKEETKTNKLGFRLMIGIMVFIGLAFLAKFIKILIMG